MYIAYTKTIPKFELLGLIIGFNKIYVYSFKWMLFCVLSTATLQQALADRCDYGIDYIPETSIDKLNETHQYKILPKPNSAYLRLVNSTGIIIQDNLYDVQPYENDYIVAKRNGYYGVIDNQGSLILNFAYDEIEVLNNNLFILTTFLGTQKSSALVSSRGQWIYPTDTTFKKGLTISSLFIDTTSNITYFKISDAGKYGIINHKGDIAVPVIYDYLEFPDKYGYFKGFITLKKDGKTGLIDRDFNFLVPMAENQIIERFYYNDHIIKITKHKPLIKPYEEDTGLNKINIISEYALSMQGKKLVETDTPFKSLDSDLYTYSHLGKTGLVNDNGEIVLNAEFDTISSNTPTSVLVYKGNKFALATDQGEGVWSIQKFYDSIDSVYIYSIEGMVDDTESSAIMLYVVSEDHKFGVIDNTGKLLIPIEFDEIEPLGSLFRVKLDNKYGLKTYTNEGIIDINYDDIQPIKATRHNDETNGYLLSQNNLQTIIDTKGQVLIPQSNIRLIEETSDFHMDGIINKDGKYGVYDFGKYEYFLEPKYEKLLNTFSNGLFLLQLEGRKVLVDEEGTLVNSDMSSYSHFEHDNNTNNIQMVSNNKYGMLNENGEIFIPAEYDYIRGEVLADDYFMFVGPVGETQEVFIAEKDGFLGVLDKQGSTVVPFEFTMIKALYVPAYLIVSKSDDETDNSVGLINSKGELLLDYQYNQVVQNYKKADGRIYGIETEKKIVDIYDSDLNLIDTQDLEEFKQGNSWIQ